MHMNTLSAKRRLPVPAMIGTTFGGLWSVLGAMALPAQWTVPAVVVGLLLTVFLLIKRYREAATVPNLFRRRAYIVAVVLEVVGLYVAALLLQRYNLEPYFVQAIGFVVGLHFIGLWCASGQRRYLWLCLVMCAASLVGIVLPSATADHVSIRDLVTSYGCALALWFVARTPDHDRVSHQT